MARDGFRIIDCHHHVGSLESIGLSMGEVDGRDPVEVELELRLHAMEVHGVDGAVVIPGHGYLRPRGQADTSAVNDAIAAYRDARPDRFPAALGIVEPIHGVPACTAELRRMRDELGLVGVSIHTRFQGVATDSPLVIGALRAAADLGLVPFVHAVDGVPDEAMWKVQQVGRAIGDHPVVVLDALSGIEHARQACVVGADCPNLVFDVSLAHHAMFVDSLLDVVGAERVVFGTDHYSMMPAPSHAGVLEDLLASSRPRAETAAILAGTLERLLSIEGWMS